MRYKQSPRERLRGILNRRSHRHDELHDLQFQVDWITAVATLPGLIDWLEAREALGLYLETATRRWVSEVVNAATDVLLESFRKPTQQPRPSTLTYEQRLELINERERQRREASRPKPIVKPLTTAERMQRAYARLEQRGAA